MEKRLIRGFATALASIIAFYSSQATADQLGMNPHDNIAFTTYSAPVGATDCLHDSYAPTAAGWAKNGSLYIFSVRNDLNIWFTLFDPNLGNFSALARLDPNVIGLSAPSAFQDRSGTTWVATVGDGSHLLLNSRSPSVNATFTGFQNIGGTTNFADIPPGIMQSGSYIHVVGVSNDGMGTLMWVRCTSVTQCDSPVAIPSSAGANSISGENLVTVVSTSSWRDDSIHVFARNTDNTIHHYYRCVAPYCITPPGVTTVNGWLGDTVANSAGSWPAAAYDSRYITVAYAGLNNAGIFITQGPGTGSWPAATLLNAPDADYPTIDFAPSILSIGPGLLDLFYAGSFAPKIRHRAFSAGMTPNQWATEDIHGPQDVQRYTTSPTAAVAASGLKRIIVLMKTGN